MMFLRLYGAKLSALNDFYFQKQKFFAEGEVREKKINLFLMLLFFTVLLLR
jgi:hypothetical protein